MQKVQVDRERKDLGSLVPIYMPIYCLVQGISRTSILQSEEIPELPFNRMLNNKQKLSNNTLSGHSQYILLQKGLIKFISNEFRMSKRVIRKASTKCMHRHSPVYQANGSCLYGQPILFVVISHLYQLNVIAKVGTPHLQ